MNIYQSTLEAIQKNAALKKAGKFNGVPYPYPRFAQYIPSIDKGQVIGITSYSGAGKSKFGRYTYITHPYEFSLVNDYPILIDVYCLEDNVQRVFKGFLCNYLYSKHKHRISLFDLDSKFRELPSEVIKSIKEGEKYLQDFNVKVRIKDKLINPYGIYKDIINTASTLGEIHKETITLKDGRKADQIIGFTPKDDTHWIAVFDNLNNIEKEAHHRDEKDAMDKFVQKDCRLLYSKIFGMTCVVIHQQALEAEKQQFTNTGGMIIDKIKPSMATLGGTKEVTRSYHLLLSLFNTHKFKIQDYKGYDTKFIGNNFRELEVLKSNDGFDNISTQLYFDGASEFFRELPNSEKQKEELEKFYRWLEEERFRQSNKSLLF